MQLDATTFALQVVNFLALLWLLHRFLYKPVQGALDARARDESAQARAMAEERSALDARASDLARQAADLAARRDEAEQALRQSIEVERQQRLAALARDVAAERQKERARMAEEAERSQRQGEQALRERASTFVAEYLGRLATPAVESAVIELFLQDLAAQTDPARQALLACCSEDGSVAIEVRTAFPVAQPARDRVQEALQALTGGGRDTVWQVDPTLLAGLCVHVPGHQLEASLRRGVDAFASQAPA